MLISPPIKEKAIQRLPHRLNRIVYSIYAVVAALVTNFLRGYLLLCTLDRNFVIWFEVKILTPGSWGLHPLIHSFGSKKGKTTCGCGSERARVCIKVCYMKSHWNGGRVYIITLKVQSTDLAATSNCSNQLCTPLMFKSSFGTDDHKKPHRILTPLCRLVSALLGFGSLTETIGNRGNRHRTPGHMQRRIRPSHSTGWNSGQRSWCIDSQQGYFSKVSESLL